MIDNFTVATRTSRIIAYLIDSLVLGLFTSVIFFFYSSINNLSILELNQNTYFFIN